jgi:hypothetical protein
MSVTGHRGIHRPGGTDHDDLIDAAVIEPTGQGVGRLQLARPGHETLEPGEVVFEGVEF